jgi:hypothetical protein
VEFLIGQVIGFSIGMLTSWLFMYLLLLIKPKVQISPFAAHNKDTNQIQVRIVNKGRRQVTNIQVSMFVAEQIKVDGGFRRRTIFRPTLKFDSLFALSPLQEYSEGDWKLPTASTFSAVEGQEIINLLSKNDSGERRLVFTVSATHSLSGTLFVRRRSYRLDDVKVGQFTRSVDFGISTKNIPN